MVTEFLKPHGLTNTHQFFDFLWNLDGGLENVSAIIANHFEGFDQLDNYIYDLHPEWNTEQNQGPLVLACANVQTPQLVLAAYRNIAFIHHKRSIELVDSMIRKRDRLLTLFESSRPLTFIYYRQYHAPVHGNYINQLDFDIGEKLTHFRAETELFMSTFRHRYPQKDFKLISLFMEPSEHLHSVTDQIDQFFQALPSDDKLIFDRVYRRRSARSLSKWTSLLKYF